MSLHVDRMIEAAIKKGEMDNLPFKGEPIPIEDDSHIHPELRMVMRILKNAGIAPPLVEEMKRIRALEIELSGTVGEAERAELAARIGRERSVVKMKLEKIANR
ncbi:MAG: DUF1992 domain-containing protein [Deltaproteobacteria bacterium]|nr:DUF1992 domain-containing protein [Deltaproteobacteria bacterium]